MKKRITAMALTIILITALLLTLQACTTAESMNRIDSQAFPWSGISGALSDEITIVENITYTVDGGKITATFDNGDTFILYDIDKDTTLEDILFSEQIYYAVNEAEYPFYYIIDENYIYAAIDRHLMKSEIGSNKMEFLVYIDERMEKSRHGNIAIIRKQGNMADSPILFYAESVYPLREHRLNYYEIKTGIQGYVTEIGYHIIYTKDTMFFTAYNARWGIYSPHIRYLTNHGDWSLDIYGNAAEIYNNKTYENITDITLSNDYLVVDESNAEIMYFYIDYFDNKNNTRVNSQKIKYNTATGEWKFISE